GRTRHELLRIVFPELAYIGKGVDDRVDQCAVSALDLADVDVQDRFAVFIDPNRPHRPAGKANVVQRAYEGGAVLELAVDGLERVLQEQSRRIRAGRVEARHHLVLVEYCLHEALVVWRVDGGRVPARGDDA